MHDADAIIRRLEALERSNHRLKLILVSAVALLLVAAKPQNVVTANGFVLVDSAGVARGRFDVSPSGSPALNHVSRKRL